MGPGDGLKLDRRLVTILAIVFVQMVGAAMILPILPLFAQDEFNLSEQVITLIISSFYMAQFIAGPYLGRLSDQRGRLPILIVSQIGTALSFALIGWAQSAWLLLAARVVDGITGGNIIVAQAYLTDVTPQEKRTQVLGYIFAVFGLGFVLGPALGGFLSASFGPRVPFYIAAGFATLTALMTGLLLDESLSPEKQLENRSFKQAGIRPVEVLRNNTLVQILIAAFIAQFALGLLQSTFALFGKAVLFQGFDEAAVLRGIGLVLATVGLTQFLTQTLLLRPLLKRFGEANLIFGGNFLRIGGMFLYAIAVTPRMGIIASVVFPLGVAVMMPSLQSLATRTVADELRGGILGVYQSYISLAVIFGTALGGTLFAISPNFPYWTGAVLGVAAIVPVGIIRQRARAGTLEVRSLAGQGEATSA